MIKNILWFVCGGFLGMIIWFIGSVALCLTIIGLPFGTKGFKVISLIGSPFKRDVIEYSFGKKSVVKNILWLALVGIELCTFHLLTGCLCGLTIIGIPFAKKHFELASLALMPYKD